MSKRFYITMFCIFVCLTITSYFFKQPVSTSFSAFMAILYLTKLLNV